MKARQYFEKLLKNKIDTVPRKEEFLEDFNEWKDNPICDFEHFGYAPNSTLDKPIVKRYGLKVQEGSKAEDNDTSILDIHRHVQEIQEYIWEIDCLKADAQCMKSITETVQFFKNVLK